jgi:hypothetical protein
MHSLLIGDNDYLCWSQSITPVGALFQYRLGLLY